MGSSAVQRSQPDRAEDTVERTRGRALDERASGLEIDNEAMPLRARAVPGLTGATHASSSIHRLVSVRGQPAAPIAVAVPRMSDDIEALISAVDATTQKAWEQIVNRPLFTGLEGLAASSGYIGLWIEKVRESIDTGAVGKMASAQFGYAVESLTTYLLKNEAAGWKLSYQIASGATRPDVVATKGTQTVWLDLTSGGLGSHAHIYTLKGWHNALVCPVPHAEITYPACDGGLQTVIKLNAEKERAGTPNPTTIDAKALEAQVKAAQARRAADIARWRKKYAPMLWAGPARVRRRSDDDGNPDPDMDARNAVLTWMNTTFKTNFRTEQVVIADDEGGRGGAARRPRTRGRADPVGAQPENDERAQLRKKAEQAKRRAVEAAARETASVLAVLDRTPAKLPNECGFVTTSYSVAQGIVFLEEHDPGDRAAGVA